MGMEDPGRYITRPTVIMLFLICVCLYCIFPSGKLPSELEEEESSSMSKGRNKGKEKASLHKEAEKGINPIDSSELIHGTKRYKLYEKKRLNFRKAEAFCKKMDGRLAKTEGGLAEMVRLTTLLQKAKSVSDEMWVGVERKQWKSHAWKEKEGPPGMNKDQMNAMGAMMMGGGKQEMCPALSSSTRALAPAMCLRELPFVCEFDRFAKPKNEREADADNNYKRAMKEKNVNKGRAHSGPPMRGEKVKMKPTQKPQRKTTPRPPKNAPTKRTTPRPQKNSGSKRITTPRPQKKQSKIRTTAKPQLKTKKRKQEL